MTSLMQSSDLCNNFLPSPCDNGGTPEDSNQNDVRPQGSEPLMIDGEGSITPVQDGENPLLAHF